LIGGIEAIGHEAETALSKNIGRTWGDGMTVTAVWHIVKESAMLREASWSRSNFFWARFGANDRTLPWLQTADSISRQ
jgi:hypothetical protein